MKSHGFHAYVTKSGKFILLCMVILLLMVENYRIEYIMRKTKIECKVFSFLTTIFKMIIKGVFLIKFINNLNLGTEQRNNIYLLRNNYIN